MCPILRVSYKEEGVHIPCLLDLSPKTEGMKIGLVKIVRERSSPVPFACYKHERNQFATATAARTK